MHKNYILLFPRFAILEEYHKKGSDYIEFCQGVK
jgi:hypothetical protein